jgi:hypothetical protein
MIPNMKAKIRVATDMYEFIELDIEGSESEIWDSYKSLKRKATNSIPGLDSKTWNICFDKYLKTNTLDSDNYEKMNDIQRQIIQEIKKSVKRIQVT